MSGPSSSNKISSVSVAPSSARSAPPPRSSNGVTTIGGLPPAARRSQRGAGSSRRYAPDVELLQHDDRESSQQDGHDEHCTNATPHAAGCVPTPAHPAPPTASGRAARQPTAARLRRGRGTSRWRNSGRAANRSSPDRRVLRRRSTRSGGGAGGPPRLARADRIARRSPAAGRILLSRSCSPSVVPLDRPKSARRRSARNSRSGSPARSSGSRESVRALRVPRPR